ncbi:MAG: sensor histidine kinase [Acidimicrobiales bacterium]
MAVVTVIGGLVAVGFLAALESRLVAAVDHELERMPDAVTRAGATVLERRVERETRLFDVRQIAFVALGPRGEVVASVPSGPTDDPDPLPDVAGLTAPAGPLTVGPAGGDGPRFRVVTSALPGGGVLASAISLADVDAALSNARRSLLVAGLAALAAVAGATWWIIRRGLRPIDRMVDTAQAIAAGDITQRVEVATPHNEVGRLGSALNRMLDRIAEALAARTRSEQRMRRFVADASHELRTPLTAIRGYAELYRRSGDDPAAVATAMDRIEQAATRMGGLVDDLVLLARLDEGRPLNARAVDVAGLVADAVADARAIEPARVIELTMTGEPSSPGGGAVVSGDGARLRQVVDNLLANVREHTDPATRVAITVESLRRDVVVTVADDGPGMDEADAARAFDRFAQAAPTGEHPRRGAGLGLAIVAELVAAHGGEITLDTAPGAGTRFTFRLPRIGSGVPR